MENEIHFSDKSDMTAKEYLLQAGRLERMVDVKLEQLQAYKDLSTKATSVLSVSPSSGTPNVHRLDGVIAKIMDLENEIIADTHKILDTRAEISKKVKSVKNDDFRMILELRYLCFMSWEQIAAELRYSKDHIFTLHRKALNEINLN